MKYQLSENMLSSHVKRSPLPWLHGKSRLCPNSLQKNLQKDSLGSSVKFIWTLERNFVSSHGHVISPIYCHIKLVQWSCLYTLAQWCKNETCTYESQKGSSWTPWKGHLTFLLETKSNNHFFSLYSRLPILFSGIVTGVLLNTMSQQQLTPLFLYTMDTTVCIRMIALYCEKMYA